MPASALTARSQRSGAGVSSAAGMNESSAAGKVAPGAPANTVSSFALGDYEWMLAFEADELHRIVDLMRHLRGTEARLHVREEIPFYTGTRVPAAELVTNLP